MYCDQRFRHEQRRTQVRVRNMSTSEVLFPRPNPWEGNGWAIFTTNST